MPGDFTVVLLVYDEAGNSEFDEVNVTVRDYISPEASISGPFSVIYGEELRLNALNSTDNGKIVKYLWTFIDIVNKEIKGIFLNHTFVSVGTVPVMLKIWDWDNNTDTEIVNVNILDIKSPIAIAGSNVVIPVGTNHTLNGSLSYDDVGIVRWVWSFMYNGENIDLEGETAFFNFDEVGENNVLLTVFDESGNFGEDRLVVKVNRTEVMDDDIDDEDDGSGIPAVWIVLILMIVILSIIGFVVFLFIKMKRKEEEPKSEDEIDARSEEQVSDPGQSVQRSEDSFLSRIPP
jgi:hypothetical protein